MLFPRPVLDGIARGEITLAFRRWDRPRVRPGSRLRTAIGVVAVESVTEVDPGAIGDVDARRAGHADAAELAAWLARPPGARGRYRRDAEPPDYTGRRVYRIALRHAGEDPRIALRASADLSPTDVAALRARLDRLDRASRRGPWTGATLRLIADRPGVRAADLAAGVGRDTPAFKTDVRKLKELGLTESLEVGYRLSPRGQALLAHLSR